jgi:uncharacterized protein DUF4238
MTGESQVSWRHHYLPQFYLRQWTTAPDGKVWCYARQPTGRVSEKRVAPKETAFEKELFSVQTVVPYMPERSPDSIETGFLKPLDTLAAPILHKLVRGESLPLTDEERTVWAVFLNSLIERDPRLIRSREQQVPAITAELKRKFLGEAPSEESRQRRLEILETMDLEMAGRNTLRTFMVREIRDKRVIDYFKGPSWQVMSVTPDLLTSDAALIVNNGSRKDPITMLSIALSPSRLMVMTPRKWTIDDEWLRAVAFSHNLCLVEGGGRFLYARQPVEDGLVRLRSMIEDYFAIDEASLEPSR